MSTHDTTFTHEFSALSEPLAVVVPPRANTNGVPEGAAESIAPRIEACHDGPADESLAGSVAWLLVLTAGQKILGLLRSVLVCRWLDPVQVGLWGMSQAAMDMAVPLLLLSIPGSFSRYMEYYRQRGQLRSFLRSTTNLSAAAFLTGIAICFLFRDSLTRLVFGESHYGNLMVLSLVAVIPAALFAFSVEWLLGARQGKTVSIAHFVRGILFTFATVALMCGWRRDVTALIAAYALSFLAAWLFLIRPMSAALRQYPTDTKTLALKCTVRRIAPAIFGCWAMDFLNNMFLTVDRYMLIHWSTDSNEDTLAAIGNYEAALVFPFLLATVAFMTARLVLPHLAKDWEQGNHTRVIQSMNLAVQLIAAVLLCGGWLVELLGGPLFTLAFRGQFPSGQHVLPLAVTFYIWMALSWVVMNYLWCVERTMWGALAMALGLATNIGLNAAWVPAAGIVGAAQATLISNALQIAVLLGITSRLGMRWQCATVLACAAPVVLSLGVGPGTLGVIVAVGITGRLMRDGIRAANTGRPTTAQSSSIVDP